MDDVLHELEFTIRRSSRDSALEFSLSARMSTLADALSGLIVSPPMNALDACHLKWDNVVTPRIKAELLGEYKAPGEWMSTEALRQHFATFAQYHAGLGTITSIADATCAYSLNQSEEVTVAIDDSLTNIPWEALFGDAQGNIFVYRKIKRRRARGEIASLQKCSGLFLCDCLRASEDALKMARWAAGYDDGDVAQGYWRVPTSDFENPAEVDGHDKTLSEVFDEMSSSTTALFFCKALDGRSVAFSPNVSIPEAALAHLHHVSGRMAALFPVAEPAAQLTTPPRGGIIAKGIVEAGWEMGVSLYAPLSMNHCTNVGRRVLEQMHEIRGGESVRDVLQNIRTIFHRNDRERTGWISVSTTDPGAPVGGCIGMLESAAKKGIGMTKSRIRELIENPEQLTVREMFINHFSVNQVSHSEKTEGCELLIGDAQGMSCGRLFEEVDNPEVLADFDDVCLEQFYKHIVHKKRNKDFFYTVNLSRHIIRHKKAKAQDWIGKFNELTAPTGVRIYFEIDELSNLEDLDTHWKGLAAAFGRMQVALDDVYSAQNYHEVYAVDLANNIRMVKLDYKYFQMMIDRGAALLRVFQKRLVEDAQKSVKWVIEGVEHDGHKKALASLVRSAYHDSPLSENIHIQGFGVEEDPKP